MEKKYLAINCAIFFWLLALIAWFSDETALARLAAACTLFAFLTHTQREKINAMFMKKNKTEAQAAEVAAPAVAAAEPEAASVKKQETTVIASGVHFVGNIVACGHVYIHGQVTGNIEAKEHLIKVMREGHVEGNISCRELIVDGKVHGQCRGDSIAIEEHGNLDGTLAYRTLAIKKGGLFTGSAEVLATAESKNKNNIVGLVAEEAVKSAKSQHA
ncbi:bactofilin family protein [Klebsiella aerogenes]|jgi:Integral membrane protein CcmA involved in cell shape determination|uniref:bactofilin family protein n=1 Tax=Klebsiella TaxID=570 RepID=UPI0025C9D374|nr:polymer-forming cytoskeletal protein [Klebsiella aerogenes]HCM7226391.1 polymer-forming cytoskeletal protein [Klebsiella aerogenes]HDG7791128.1 polymer-forming cytoskeletal protein [Klebsiella aerogenes]HDT2542561.1 polymer-forming cytoskeletal protein [Klebsiella aerogenes]HDU4713949.1 polymer-forming cytoskeletal protein [Klebsiella aerogenes]